MTIVLACCAYGLQVPPMLIFKRKTIPKEAFPSGGVIETNAKGWMDERMMGDSRNAFLSDCFFHKKKGLLVLGSMRARIKSRL